MRLTWQDYRQLPPSRLRHEVLAGELVVSPAPNLRHQQVLRNLTRELVRLLGDTGRAEVLFAPVDVRLSEQDVFQPDLLVVMRENLHRLRPDFVDGPPDLVVEVLSPGTAHRDRGGKLARYAAHGVRECWLVDPEANLVEQWILTGQTLRHHGTHRERIAPHVAADVVVELDRVL